MSPIQPFEEHSKIDKYKGLKLRIFEVLKIYKRLAIADSYLFISLLNPPELAW